MEQFLKPTCNMEPSKAYVKETTKGPFWIAHLTYTPQSSATTHITHTIHRGAETAVVVRNKVKTLTLKKRFVAK